MIAWLPILMCLLFWAICISVFASDISVIEEVPDVSVWKLDTVRFLVFTETAEITYRKVDTDGKIAGNDVKILFRNEVDNPQTPEDETSTEFTQLIQAINSGDNIKQTITNAVKIKLGL